MKSGWLLFRIAVGFLTILPINKPLPVSPARLGQSVSLFPAVGVLLGLLLVVVNSLLDALLPRAVLDCLLLLALVVVTGALNLGGLSSLFASLAGDQGRAAGGKGPGEERWGSMGTAGLVMLVLLKYLALFHLPLGIKSAGLIFMPCAGRWVQVVLAISCRYLPGERDVVLAFREYAGERELLIASGSLIAVALILFGLQGVFLVFLLGIAIIVLIKYFEMRLGGVNDDALGASCELVEILSLLLVLAVV